MNLRLASYRGALRRTAALALMTEFVLTVTGSRVSAAEKPVVHRVVMKATSYAPLELRVKLGDSVVWANEDFFPHTVTDGGVFDSGSIAPGASWKYMPQRRGEYAYTCTFHPNMKGVLKVE